MTVDLGRTTCAPRAALQSDAGSTEYRIVGGGEQVWADTIDATERLAVEVKWAGPARSPFIPDSGVPDLIRDMINARQEAEFWRYRQVIADPGNPLIGLRVITNSDQAADYVRGLMARLNLPGEVLVR